MLRRLAFAPLALAAACATNPVTGKSELSLVSESQEIQIGKEEAQKVAQSIGYYDDAAVQSYVAGIGQRLAAASERPQLPWEFHVVEDASVNAFALPGGFIFVTRGLMSSITNEAELASVIGHEIAHVTHRHSVQQISRAQVAQIGLVAGSVLSSTVAQYGGLLGQGLGVLFLKYGRDAELEADQSGFRYALNDRYDVRQMINMFEVLQGVSNLSDAGKLPEWLSTHPDPGNRIEATTRRLDTLSLPPNLKVNREEYLQRIARMPYGDDPRQGFFRGSRFLHPALRFQLELPDGWPAQNMPSAVVAVSPNKDAIVQLGLAGNVEPTQAARQFLSQEGIRAGQSSTESVNGNPAATSYFAAQTEQGEIRGLVSFVSYRGTTYGIMGYTAASALSQYDGTFKNVIRSFRSLDDPSALNVQPARIELVQVDRPMTVTEFNQRYPSPIRIEELALINGLEGPDDIMRPGRQFKRVVGTVYATSTNQAAKAQQQQQ
ncbi:MAG TPA: M48 family metalloprotease [Gemmatimonadales bacterium]|nr:M48 family metalloprotease [Gemmatimonadales bacterium]